YLSNDRSVAFVDSNAAATSLTKRLTPLALLCDSVEHAEEVGFVGQQRPAELIGVLPRRLRQLINIAFDEERILRGTDRSPEHDRYVRVLQHTANTHARNRVGDIGETFDSLRLDAVLNLIDARRTQDRTDGDLRVECSRHAILPKRRFHAHCRLRPIPLFPHSFFPP